MAVSHQMEGRFMRHLLRVSLATLAIVAASSLAHAGQAAKTMSARGTVSAVSPESLTVKGKTDTWTFTAAGLPWLDQQWGAQVVLGGVYGLAGWTGLATLRALMVALITALVLVAIRRTAPTMPRRTAALLTLAAFIVMSPALALRPQLFGLVLFAATLFVLADRANRDRWLWTLPVIAMAWANIHGSFILAPVLVALACLEDLLARTPIARRMVEPVATASAA